MAEEPRREEAPRLFVEILRRPRLDHASAAHQDDPVADPHRLLRIVGHHHRRRAAFAQDRDRVGADAVPKPAVETRERLVHQEDAGTWHDGAGQRDALLLAAGSLMRIGIRHMRQPDARERRERLLAPRPAIERAKPEHDVAQNRHMREQRIILEHQADRPLLRRDEHRRAVDLLAIDQHPPRIRAIDARRDPEKGRLAAPGMAEERDHLAGLDVEAHPGERDDIAETAVHVLEGQPRSDCRSGAAAAGALQDGDHRRLMALRAGGGKWIARPQ